MTYTATTTNALKSLLAAMGILLAAAVSNAEEIVVFDAFNAGDEVWHWGGAKAKTADGVITISEMNPDGNYGDAFPDVKIPLLPRLAIDTYIQSVDTGAYTIQLMAFKGDQFLSSMDVVTGSTEPGPHVIDPSTVQLPPDADSVRIKFWAVHAEGATFTLSRLRASASLPADSIRIDDMLKPSSGLELDKTEWAESDGEEVLKLSDGATFGSILRPDSFPLHDNTVILFHAPSILGGVMTLQLVLFDTNGLYLDSIDAVKHEGAGWHSTRPANLALPDRAAAAAVKIWIAGGPDVRLKPGRLIVADLD